jgi:hypothetical protein
MTQAYNLSQLANNLDTSGRLDASDGLVNAVPIANGGTGATTAAGAASALQAEIGKLMYPVGSIYINATSSTNPSTLLGFGTWVAFGAGRVPVSYNAGDPSFNTAEGTGGSKDAIVVSHSHTATSTVTDPGHTHNVLRAEGYQAGSTQWAGNGNPGNGTYTTATQSATTGISVSTTVASAGSSGTNANLPPYIVVYMWKRTA